MSKELLELPASEEERRQAEKQKEELNALMLAKLETPFVVVAEMARKWARADFIADGAKRGKVEAAYEIPLGLPKVAILSLQAEGAESLYEARREAIADKGKLLEQEAIKKNVVDLIGGGSGADMEIIWHELNRQVEELEEAEEGKKPKKKRMTKEERAQWQKANRAQANMLKTMAGAAAGKIDELRRNGFKVEDKGDAEDDAYKD